MPIINTKPDMSYGVWAENGNTETPSSEKVGEGWVVEKPFNETMNWVQNRQDSMLQYLNQRGIAEWDIRTEYPEGAYTSRAGKIYKAATQNMDADPTLHPDIWSLAFVDYADFVDFTDKIEKIENEDGYLGLYLKKSDPNSLAPYRGTEFNNRSNSSGYRFVENTPIVSNSGMTVAEFSGGNNPKDVVTHEQLNILLQTYRIGDIYITTNNQEPAQTLGYGTWERYGQGQALVGFSTSVSNDTPQWVKTVNSTFGSYTHKMTESELPKHKHGSNIRVDGADGTLIDNNLGFTTTDGRRMDWLDYRSTKSTHTTEVGGGQPHNNVQPSVVVFLWKRTS